MLYMPRLAIVFLFLSHAVLTDNKPPALRNLSGSCYLNATLQCLHNFSEIRELVNNIPPLNIKQRTTYPLVHPVLEALRLMQQKDNLVYNTTLEDNCENVMQTMQDHTESTTREQDATEFFVKFTEQLKGLFDNTAHYPSEIIANLFFVKEKEITSTKYTNRDLVKSIDNTGINLKAFPNKPRANFTELITEQYEPSTVEDFPDPGDISTATRYITQLPRCLCFQITRYTYVIENGEVKRKQRQLTVDIPQEITFVRTDVSTEHINNPIQVLSKDVPYYYATYRINSAAIYSGDATRGHYWAYVLRDNTWFECDDATITKGAQFAPQWTLGNPFPYLILYERVSQEPAPPQQKTISDKLQAAKAELIESELKELYNCLNTLYNVIHKEK